MESSAPKSFQFTLRAILTVTAVCAAWCALLRLLPHVAVFMTGTIPVIQLSVRMVLRKRRGQAAFGGYRMAVVFVASLFLFYVVSIGPVVAVMESVGIEPSIGKPIYYPVIWLHHNTPLRKPLELYAEAWGWH